MADVGTGTTLGWGTTTGLNAMEVTSIEHSGTARESRDVSHLSTAGGRTFISGDLYDPGELSVEGFLGPTLGDTFPIGSAKETFTVTFPDGTTFAASGFLMEYGWNVPLDEEMTFSMTIKLSDEITWTDA